MTDPVSNAWAAAGGIWVVVIIRSDSGISAMDMLMLDNILAFIVVECVLL